MKKKCEACGASFAKGAKLSARQWEIRRFCSNRCSGRVNIKIAKGGWNNTQHGETRSPTWVSWFSMRQRCSDPNRNAFHRYGGRGVKVCERWGKFEAFLEDMGVRPKGTSLDRYPDNDGDYEPSNCRWATRSEQMANSSQAKNLTLGKRTMCISEWARLLKLPLSTLRKRLKKHPPSIALTSRRFSRWQTIS